MELLAQYGEQITSIVMFANRINYNIEEQGFENLMRLWINDTKKTHEFINDNKQQVIAAIKTML
jgi:hypothetical protein